MTTAQNPVVTVIPANFTNGSGDIYHPGMAKKKAGAYARVSTDEDDQLNSYAAQVEFYTEHIKSNPDWEFVEIYADEGLSGTSRKNRKNFNRMIDDALAGKLDLILTKSVSRFARNTVDALTAIRQLKEKGCAVWFEKEYIFFSINPYLSTYIDDNVHELSLICRSNLLCNT
jgi:hypothetical protein